MKLLPVALAALALSFLLVGIPASADDGAITNKNMSRTIQVPTLIRRLTN